MNAELIHKLAWYLPLSKAYHDVPEDQIEFAGIETSIRDIAHYLNCYKDIAFGWKLAYRLARSGRELPSMLEGEDLWVYRAYLYIAGVSNDPIVGSALSLTLSAAESQRVKIQALLLSKYSTIPEIANRLHMDARVISAYEKLFFNVLDRKEDGMYLADIVYPEGRYVEFMNGYLETEPISMLLKRSGYNNGSGDVLYMSGMPNTTLESLFPSDDSASRFEKYLMMNGYALGRNGFINQGNMPGIHHARQVLQAIKQGGEGDEAVNPFKTMGQSLLEDLTRVKRKEAELQIGYRRGTMKLLD